MWSLSIWSTSCSKRSPSRSSSSSCGHRLTGKWTSFSALHVYTGHLYASFLRRMLLGKSLSSFSFSFRWFWFQHILHEVRHQPRRVGKICTWECMNLALLHKSCFCLEATPFPPILSWSLSPWVLSPRRNCLSRRAEPAQQAAPLESDLQTDPPEELRETFKRFDKSGDGQICAKELSLTEDEIIEMNPRYLPSSSSSRNTKVLATSECQPIFVYCLRTPLELHVNVQT